MPDEFRLLLGFAVALVGVAVTVPLAILVAERTGFFDRPAGYKAHGSPTPYLGGAAVIVAFLVPAMAFGAGAADYAAIVAGAVILLAIGTVDDRVGVGPLLRVLVEAGLAVLLWNAGLGWDIFESQAANLALTVFWIVGVVNAFNLMDNMDGAAGSVAAVAAGATAILALTHSHPELAALLLALAGALAGFLPRNLAKPSRIFLGDGGSMPVGFVVAAGVMVIASAESVGASALLVAAPLVGLPILDTTLVVISRRRRGAQILAGGRDHLTHRLRSRLGSARAVAAALAVGQAALCAVATAIFDSGSSVIIAATISYVLVGAAVIWMLEVTVSPGATGRRTPVTVGGEADGPAA